MPNNLARKILFRFLSNLCVQLLLPFPGNETPTMAVILESTLLTFFSPARPATPDNSHHRQPNLMPTTSRVDPHPNLFSLTLTPIQRFIHNGQNSKNWEPKYNHSQPHQPDP